jgi:hypothetical protein
MVSVDRHTSLVSTTITRTCRRNKALRRAAVHPVLSVRQQGFGVWHLVGGLLSLTLSAY